MQYKIVESQNGKMLLSENYKFIFDKNTGYFERWGAKREDDPQFSPIGPEIADIAITENGCSMGCRYCYKNNTIAEPKNMSLETFKSIVDSLGKQLTQVAFGITDADANPDFLDMMLYCRQIGVAPNFTTSGKGLTGEFVSSLKGVAGAVSVSYHGDMELCFRTVEDISLAGVEQVNVHAVTADFESLMNLLSKIAMRRRVSESFKLNSLVLLSLKPKGRAHNMRSITDDEIKQVIARAEELRIPIGFDSCSAHVAMDYFPVETHESIEPCESSLFSIYIGVDGLAYPCSFAEGEFEGVPVLGKDFIKDVWNHPRMEAWRENLLEKGRHCTLSFGGINVQKEEKHAKDVEGSVRSLQNEVTPEIRDNDRLVRME